MNVIEQINSHKYLFLTEIGEPEENVLRIVIEEGKLSEPTKEENITESNEALKSIIAGSREIMSDESCYLYEIVFDTYIAYSVRNESYAIPEDSSEFSGGFFGTYSKSSFLDYLKISTFATEDYPGKFVHYGLSVFRYFIDIASVYEPEMKILRFPKEN
ncbi:MAG: hypothetical protein ACR2HG_12065 [Pyrinomonadaceae bacterium]